VTLHNTDEGWSLIEKVRDQITAYYNKTGDGPCVEDMVTCLRINGGDHLMRRSILSHLLVRKIDPLALGFDEERMKWAMQDLYEDMENIREELKEEIKNETIH
jgi:hypothetical protein